MGNNNSRINIASMLKKLDAMFIREEEIINNFELLTKEYNQLQEDKEMLQTSIIYMSNKIKRMRR